MERDFILGYLALKGASLLGMHLDQRRQAPNTESWPASLDLALLAIALAGFGLGLWLMAAAWTKARHAARGR